LYSSISAGAVQSTTNSDLRYPQFFMFAYGSHLNN